MSRRTFFLIAIALVAAIGLDIHLAGLASARRASREALLRELAAQRRELADLQAKQAATAREQAVAEQQLAQLPPVPPADTTAAALATDALVREWMGRTRRLRELVARRPESVIPEMALLTDADWIAVARYAAFGTEAHLRKTLAELRSAGKIKFVPQLSTALQKFNDDGHSQLPASTLDLARYFETPADPAMLQRYALTRSGAFQPHPGTESVIRESQAVDPDYDSRYDISAGGYGSSRGPAAWIEGFQPRMARAFEAYRAANQGAQPKSLSQVVPYIDPPLSSSTIEALLISERPPRQ